MSLLRLTAAVFIACGCADSDVTVLVRGVAPEEGLPEGLSDTGVLFSQAGGNNYDDASPCTAAGTTSSIRVPRGVEARIVLAYLVDHCFACSADVDVTYDAPPVDVLEMPLTCESHCAE